MKKTYCVACGSKENLNHHHLVPRSAGGTEDESNLITLCEPCHAKAHGRAAADFRRLTIDGLRKAKERGVRLGCPNPRKGNAIAVQRLKGDADAFAESIRPHIESVRTLPARKIAEHLMSSGVKTRKGGDKWHASQVCNLLSRLYP